VGQSYFVWHDSIKDGEGDDRCLAFDLGDGRYATDERAFGNEHFVTRQVKSWHFTSLSPGDHCWSHRPGVPGRSDCPAKDWVSNPPWRNEVHG
jgi:hypothetical protein